MSIKKAALELQEQAINKMIQKEVKRLEKKSDKEIMEAYFEQLISRFPLVIKIDALEDVMKERGITPGDRVVNLAFLLKDGETYEISKIYAN